MLARSAILRSTAGVAAALVAACGARSSLDAEPTGDPGLTAELACTPSTCLAPCGGERIETPIDVPLAVVDDHVARDGSVYLSGAGAGNAVAKLAMDGSLIWRTTVSNDSSPAATKIDASDGEVYVAHPRGLEESYELQRVEPDGALGWSRPLPHASLRSGALAFAADPRGGVFVATGGASFETSLEVDLTRVDGAGTTLWSRAFPAEYPSGLIVSDQRRRDDARTRRMQGAAPAGLGSFSGRARA